MQDQRIVVSLLTEDQEFQRMQAADARAAGSRAGIDVVVEFADNSPILQIQQIFRHLHAPEQERPVAVVVEAVAAEGLERVARNAMKARIGWVMLNWRVPYVARLREEYPGLPVCTVAADEAEIGRIQARQYRALAPQGGGLLYISGPPETTTAQGRLDGLRESLGSAFDVKVLNGDWTEASGQRAVASWLRLKTSEGFHPVLVGSQNDAMAAGARRALLAHHPDWSQVPFLGCDGLPEGGQRLVERGDLAATIVKPTTAGAAVELVVGSRRSAGGRADDLVLAPRSWPPEQQLSSRRAASPRSSALS